jgi:hypothetical protein
MQMLCFPVSDEKKKRLETVCERLGITIEEFFETSLLEAEFDVIVRNMSPDSSPHEWLLGRDRKE